ncbi:DUF167 domain-containing protein [Magnetovibrio blakemorei]|uniref:UPF0235 protein BEN30_01130 n=1 Tax=Magnetovibrio blakemorei TaxID=28181 RepID=A0A1E5Q414_9PROT|nr:DUF167 domain-containing protein [Magnetovibrio blakemorei]OEJ64040.1 hypothetical protein BEN30_01130 [Magnetovibrio blakemorei]
MGGAVSFAQITPEGLRLRIRLTPSGRRDGFDGVMLDADDNGVLKASVTKAPEDGKANQALIKMLAKEWKVAKSLLDVIQGQTNRNKVVLIRGDADALNKQIGDWAHSQDFA